MYGVDINGTTTTVDIGAMTALKRDGSASIPASLVNELKGILVNRRVPKNRYGIRHKNPSQIPAKTRDLANVVGVASMM